MLVGNEPGAAQDMEREERRDWVRRAIEQLPEQLRSALILVYYQGIKYHVKPPTCSASLSAPSKAVSMRRS